MTESGHAEELHGSLTTCAAKCQAVLGVEDVPRDERGQALSAGRVGLSGLLRKVRL